MQNTYTMQTQKPLKFKRHLTKQQPVRLQVLFRTNKPEQITDVMQCKNLLNYNCCKTKTCVVSGTLQPNQQKANAQLTHIQDQKNYFQTPVAL